MEIAIKENLEVYTNVFTVPAGTGITSPIPMSGAGGEYPGVLRQLGVASPNFSNFFGKDNLVVVYSILENNVTMPAGGNVAVMYYNKFSTKEVVNGSSSASIPTGASGSLTITDCCQTSDFASVFFQFAKHATLAYTIEVKVIVKKKVVSGGGGLAPITGAAAPTPADGVGKELGQVWYWGTHRFEWNGSYWRNGTLFGAYYPASAQTLSGAAGQIVWINSARAGSYWPINASTFTVENIGPGTYEIELSIMGDCGSNPGVFFLRVYDKNNNTIVRLGKGTRDQQPTAIWMLPSRGLLTVPAGTTNTLRVVVENAAANSGIYAGDFQNYIAIYRRD